MFNGNRLKEARNFCRLSITELASQIGVTKQMISKYETGKSEPSSETMFKIIQSLKFPNSFFVTGDSKITISNNETFFRSRFTATQKQKSPTETIKNVAYMYRDFLEDYIDFPTTKKIKLDEGVDAELASELLRSDWALDQLPIYNMVNLLEVKGFVIATIPDYLDKVDAFSGLEVINGKEYYIIFIDKKNTNFFRNQFTVAHELGHYILHSENIDPLELNHEEYKQMEQEANDFASAFLMPASEFSTDVEVLGYVRSVDQLIHLKTKYHVSLGAIIMRIKKLKLWELDDVVRLQKQMSSKGYRKQEPLDKDSELALPQSLWEGSELLVKNKVVEASSIADMINNKFNKEYPTNLIENVVNLPDGYLNKGESMQDKLSLKKLINVI